MRVDDWNLDVNGQSGSFRKWWFWQPWSEKHTSFFNLFCTSGLRRTDNWRGGDFFQTSRDKCLLFVTFPDELKQIVLNNKKKKNLKVGKVKFKSFFPFLRYQDSDGKTQSENKPTGAFFKRPAGDWALDRWNQSGYTANLLQLKRFWTLFVKVVLWDRS